MGYKFKPNKGVAKRMKLTGTGKLKHRHEKNSHLRSGRSSALKRRLGRPAVLAEGHSRNMRRLLGVEGKRPNQVAHERAADSQQKETSSPGTQAS
jgi:large subunit ribosomal protein L35